MRSMLKTRQGEARGRFLLNLPSWRMPRLQRLEAFTSWWDLRTPCHMPIERVESIESIEPSGNHHHHFSGFAARTVKIRWHEQLQQKISNLPILVASQMDITSYDFTGVKVPS